MFGFCPEETGWKAGPTEQGTFATDCYRPWDPDQDGLLPPSPRDWLPEGDRVYFMLDVVKTMDLSSMASKYEREERGFPPFHPRRMVTLRLYSYCLGVYSSRRVQKQGMIEPIFGQIKQVRGLGQFLLRGLEKVRAEWRLICLTHNLLKLFRRQRWAMA